MLTTLGVKDYDLVLPLGVSQPTNVVRIFPQGDKHKVRYVFLRFTSHDNDQKDLLKDFQEDTATGLGIVRMHLGENQKSKVLDFLRNESDRNISFRFDPDKFVTTGFADHDDDGIFRTVKVFHVSSVVLHSEGSRRVDISTPVQNPEPVIGQ